MSLRYPVYMECSASSCYTEHGHSNRIHANFSVLKSGRSGMLCESNMFGCINLLSFAPSSSCHKGGNANIRETCFFSGIPGDYKKIVAFAGIKSPIVNGDLVCHYVPNSGTLPSLLPFSSFDTYCSEGS